MHIGCTQDCYPSRLEHFSDASHCMYRVTHVLDYLVQSDHVKVTLWKVRGIKDANGDFEAKAFRHAKDVLV